MGENSSGAGAQLEGKSKIAYHVILAVMAAGGAGSWLKPTDTNATEKSYEATASAIANMAEDVNADRDDFDQDSRDFARYVDDRFTRLERYCEALAKASHTEGHADAKPLPRLPRSKPPTKQATPPRPAPPLLPKFDEFK